MTIECENCGTTNERGTPFCSWCGHDPADPECPCSMCHKDAEAFLDEVEIQRDRSL